MSDEFTQDIEDLIAILQNGDSAQMMEHCQQRVAEGSLNPYHFLAMGIVCYCNGDPGLGLQLLERGHGIDPNCRELVDALASCYTRVGRLADGLYYGKLAVCLKPRPDAQPLVPPDLSSYMDSLQNVGVSHHGTNAEAAIHLGLFREALAQAEKHLRIHPDDDSAMLAAAKAMLGIGRPAAAASMLRAALHHRPQDPWLHAVLADALMGVVRHGSALEHQRLALDLAGDDDALRAHVVGALALQSGANWPAAEGLINAYADDREAPWRRVAARTPSEPGITGLLCDQVYDGPLINCLVPVFRQLQGTVLYTLNARHDHMSEALRTSVMRPRKSIGIDDATLGRIILGDQAAAVINLCSPNEPARFPVFKGEGAPLMVHWVTAPMCDRLPGADVVLGDAETADVDRRTYGDDRVLSLTSLLAFDFPQILAPEDEILDLPRNTRGFAMFGVHGGAGLLTEDSVSLWARVLWAVPDAHLMIGGQDEWDEALVAWALDTFAEYGLSSRVHFQAPVEGVAANPARTFPHMVDIVLDSTPVGGLTELAWDLWMGVPVVTLRGIRRAGRVGASILRAVGRTEWIADNADAYVAIAAGLARDRALGEVRSGLRSQLQASRLANPAALADEIAARLRDAVAARSAGA